MGVRTASKHSKRNTEFRLSSRQQHARTPQWLWNLLEAHHGPLHDQCPPEPQHDCLQATWRSTSYVNPPFSSAKQWLIKAAEEAQRGTSSIVLLPCRFHTKHFHEAVPFVERVQVLAKPIRFEDTSGNEHKRRLPAAVCLLQFGGSKRPLPAEPRARLPAHFVRLRPEEATFDTAVAGVEAHVGPCKRIGSPLNGQLRSCLQAHENQVAAALCPARLENTEVQEAIAAAEAVLFVSPPLLSNGSKRRCVEGSMVVCFASASALAANKPCCTRVLELVHQDALVERAGITAG